MSSAEFAEWMAYHGVEPFGSPTDDLRFGTVASAAGSAFGGKFPNPLDWWAWRLGPAPAATGDWRDIMAAMGRVAKPAKGGGG